MAKKWKSKAAAKAKQNVVIPPQQQKVETKSPVGAVTTDNAPGLVPQPTPPHKP